MPGQNDYPSPDNYQQTSFPQPVPAPSDEPDEGNLLYVAYNPLWTPVLMAAVDQLLQYGTWNGTDEEKILAVNRSAYLKWMLQNPVNVVPERQPYWDEEDGADAPGDDEATGFPWYEEIADWAVTAFLAVSFTPDAAIEFVTTARKLRLWFRTRDYGAIVRVLLDGLEIGEVDTYSEAPGMTEFAYDIPEAFTALDVPTWTLRVEHTGTHNASATPTADGYAAEVIRKHIEWGIEGAGTCNRVWRVNGDGELEYSDDGAESWTPATEDPTYPPLNPREETTDEEKLCLASRNAVEIIRLTYETAVTEWNSSLSPVATAGEVLALIGATIGIFFSAAWAVLFAFGAVLFNQMLTGLTGLITGDWVAGDTERLTCKLLQYATLNPDDTVTFNYQAVLDEAPQLLSIGGTQGFVRWILETMGEDGLNHAGATTSIETYDCTDCENWCYVFDFAEDDGGLVAFTDGNQGTIFGAYDAANGRWRGSFGILYPNDYRGELNLAVQIPAATTITRIMWDGQLVKGALPGTNIEYIQHSVNVGGGELGTWHSYPVSNIANYTSRNIDVGVRPVSAGDYVNLRLPYYRDWSSPFTDSGYIRINRLYFFGTGTNPWGADNCS